MPLTADMVDRTTAGIRRFCAEATSTQVVLRGVAERIRPVVPFDAGAWLVIDPTTWLFSDAYVHGFDATTCHPWFHHEFHVTDIHKFADIAGSGRAWVLSDSPTARTDSPRWSTLMRPHGLDAELRITLDDVTRSWGAVEIHREVGRPDFDADEAELFGRVASTVATALRRIAVDQAARVNPAADGPGLLLIDCDGAVTPATDAGAAWLDLLLPDNQEQWDPAALLALCAMVRAGQPAPHRVKVRAADGRWVTLHAAPRTDEGGTVIIVEPSRPADLAGVVALAHGLSVREQEVAVALARGRSTGRIADDLFISPHTVRDHVKAVLSKVGVSSRAELVATMFGDDAAAQLDTGG